MQSQTQILPDSSSPMLEATTDWARLQIPEETLYSKCRFMYDKHTQHTLQLVETFRGIYVGDGFVLDNIILSKPIYKITIMSTQ